MKIKKIAIVSLSRGLLGEDIVKASVERGLERLKDKGLEVIFAPNAHRGIAYLEAHPEARAEDLLTVIEDDSVDLILCAIGGEDTYRLAPYLFDQDQLRTALAQAGRPKRFLGFSDTTTNHLMFHQVGLPTFYGQAFLPDICELSPEMLPYTEYYFDAMIETGTIRDIRPSQIWYEERSDFSAGAIGTTMPTHPNPGFDHLQGPTQFSGEILGGCLESLYCLLQPYRYPDSAALAEHYQLFPSLEDWHGKILLLETSEDRTAPQTFRQMVQALKGRGIFDVISGLLVGKPQDNAYYDEYKQILLDVIGRPDLPVVANLNIGHCTPRCIIPFGIPATVDTQDQVIRFAPDWEDFVTQGEE